MNWKKQAEELFLRREMSRRQIARTLGVPKSTLCDYLRTVDIPETTEDRKVLVFDIERSPSLASVWGMWGQNINATLLEADSYMMTWAAKWLHKDEIFYGSLYESPAYASRPEDDRGITASLKDLLDEASVVVAHNGDRFDIKFLNTRLLYHNLGPTSPFRSVDTLKVAKRKFLFPHNSLDGILRYLGMDRKSDHEGFEMWRKCMNGDANAWKKMLEYNINDVIVLEALYLRMNPYDHLSGNVSVEAGKSKLSCSHCGSENLAPSEATYTTATSEYSVFKCLAPSCGGYSRSRINARSREAMRNTLVPTR